MNCGIIALAVLVLDLPLSQQNLRNDSENDRKNLSDAFDAESKFFCGLNNKQSFQVQVDFIKYVNSKLLLYKSSKKE